MYNYPLLRIVTETEWAALLPPLLLRRPTVAPPLVFLLMPSPSAAAAAAMIAAVELVDDPDSTHSTARGGSQGSLTASWSSADLKTSSYWTTDGESMPVFSSSCSFSFSWSTLMDGGGKVEEDSISSRSSAIGWTVGERWQLLVIPPPWWCRDST